MYTKPYHMNLYITKKTCPYIHTGNLGILMLNYKHYLNML